MGGGRLNAKKREGAGMGEGDGHHAERGNCVLIKIT